MFRTVLDDRQIKSERRLFATATPRVYRTGLKKAAEEFGVEVVDMNDEKSFGKRFHTLTFGEAIKRDLLTDYRVLIVGVDNDRIKEWIENRRLVATDTGLATDARSLAGANRFAESNQGLESSEAHILPWSGEKSQRVFRRHHSGCGMAG